MLKMQKRGHWNWMTPAQMVRNASDVHHRPQLTPTPFPKELPPSAQTPTQSIHPADLHFLARPKTRPTRHEAMENRVLKSTRLDLGRQPPKGQKNKKRWTLRTS